jgi:hypothetical protein
LIATFESDELDLSLFILTPIPCGSARMLDDIEANRDRLDILKCVTLIEQPILIIRGARDESVPVGESAEIESFSQSASRVSDWRVRPKWSSRRWPTSPAVLDSDAHRDDVVAGVGRRQQVEAGFRHRDPAR